MGRKESKQRKNHIWSINTDTNVPTYIKDMYPFFACCVTELIKTVLRDLKIPAKYVLYSICSESERLCVISTMLVLVFQLNIGHGHMLYETNRD